MNPDGQIYARNLERETAAPDDRIKRALEAKLAKDRARLEERLDLVEERLDLKAIDTWIQDRIAETGAEWRCQQHPTLRAFHDDCAGPAALVFPRHEHTGADGFRTVCRRSQEEVDRAPDVFLEDISDATELSVADIWWRDEER
jgi:hypothetical protein